MFAMFTLVHQMFHWCFLQHPTAKVQNLHHCITSLLVIVLGFWRANILYFMLVGEQKFSSGGEPMRSRSGVEHFDQRTKRLKWRLALILLFLLTVLSLLSRSQAHATFLFQTLLPYVKRIWVSRFSNSKLSFFESLNKFYLFIKIKKNGRNKTKYLERESRGIQVLCTCFAVVDCKHMFFCI